MNKRLPYIIGSLLALLVLLLVITSKRQKERIFDSRLTFNRKDKIPYGTFVAYQGLSSLYPSTTISTSKQEPGTWDSLSMYEDGQALVIISPNFDVDESEMNKLISFVNAGNDVFVSTIDFQYDFRNAIKSNASSSQYLMENISEENAQGNMVAKLAAPPFQNIESMTYPGYPFNLCFSTLDTARAFTLGYGINENVNFIHLKAGKGNLYVHLSPILFTNYFLLHKDNIRYYEQALSVISPSTRKIVWDEYFLTKRTTSPSSHGWFSAFMKIDSFKWALIVAIFTLLLFAVMEMRRKQRIIPVVPKPVNDSLEFVKTIGRLYHEKGDHANLMRKMSSYFLEQVRTRYNLPTRNLNEEFVDNLHYRSGYPQDKLALIIQFIHDIEMNVPVNDKRLVQFHKQLENFYSAT